MANSNVPSSEPESVLSGHTMERARGGVAPLVTLLIGTAVAGVAKKANAEVRCDPVNFSIQRNDGSTSVAGTVTPQSDSNMRVDATFGERNDRSYGMTVKPGDACTEQAGIDVTVHNRRGPHLNACTCESGLCLFHTSRNAQGGRVADGHTSMPIPRCVETQPPPPTDTNTGGTGPGRSGDQQPPVAPPAPPRAPNPAEIFAESPEGFSVQARYELSADRAPGVAPGPILSPSASWRRGDLRTLQFDPDQLPAPAGMDFERRNMLVAPDGNGGLNSGLYVAVGQSVSGSGAPYKAVYVAYVLPSSDPQNLHFNRVYPPLGSDVGSGGSPTVEFNGVLSVNRREGDFSAFPRESSNDGLRNCDAIPLSDEGLVGNSPVAVLCEMIRQNGARAIYVGTRPNMIGPVDVAHPDVVRDLQNARDFAIEGDGETRRIANVDPAAEGMELPNVQFPLARMRYHERVFPTNTRALLDNAVSHFMRRPNYQRQDGQAPATTPAVRPTPPLPSSPPSVPPPAQAPSSFRSHRVQNRRAA